MCELQDGQIVDVDAPETCCFRLNSKHSTTRLVCRFQKSSSLPKIDEEVSGAGASSVVRSFRPGFGANGVKERPHWRHIELLAAAYSICLKPQCGHSTLTLAGDGLATAAVSENFSYPRPPKAALTGSCRTISGRAGADLAGIVPLVTSDLPIKVAPSSMTRRAAFKSPCSVHFDFNSARSATVIFPCTLPYTVIDLVLTSPRMSAFSPIVSTPSELISPSTFPSMRSSFWNLIEPLISTSLERMSLPPCSAIGFW